jgi:DNA-binding PadR family transcriptional regulator
MTQLAFGRYSNPALLILASLADGSKHGYAMMEDIEQMVGVKLGAGTLYGALARLEERGLIEAVETEDRRRPYRLTSLGRSTLHDSLQSLQAFAAAGLKRLGANT